MDNTNTSESVLNEFNEMKEGISMFSYFSKLNEVSKKPCFILSRSFKKIYQSFYFSMKYEKAALLVKSKHTNQMKQF